MEMVSQSPFEFDDPFDTVDPFDTTDEPLDDALSPTYTVTELADAINRQLRRGFDDGVWVRGEIDGLRNSGPHTYFTLVEDGDQGKAVLNVSLFAPVKRNLTPHLKRSRLELANGVKVRIFGALDFYAPTGRLGLKMAGLDTRFTLGELSQARDQTVRRLVASGLYDANRKLTMPMMPLRVGVVTSVGSAAWHDFVEELKQSGFGFELSVIDTRVQGEWAVDGVAAAIRTLARRSLDCVVVIRGGGARNELAVFDAEPIALAIATSRLPVITGLGHEVDRSVADDVAHTALKTPTACAGTLIAAVSQARDRAEAAWSSIGARASLRLDDALTVLVDRTHRVARRTDAAVERASERLSARVDRVATLPVRRLDLETAALASRADRVSRRAPQQLADQARRVDDAASRLALLDPANLLRRGWTITRRSDGTIVRSIDDVAVGDVVRTATLDGSLSSRIESTERNS